MKNRKTEMATAIANDAKKPVIVVELLYRNVVEIDDNGKSPGQLLDDSLRDAPGMLQSVTFAYPTEE